MNYETLDLEYDFSLSKKGVKNTGLKSGSRGGGKNKKNKRECRKNKTQVYSQKSIRVKLDKVKKWNSTK
jgi:hypothetical protein